MKVLLIVAISFFLIFACKKDSEKYIAKVNGVGIKRTKFNKIVSQRVRQIEKFGRKITPMQKHNFQKRLLDNLINEELLLIEAKKFNIKTAPAEVTKKLESIKARYPKKEAFENILKQQELTEKDLQEMFEKQLTIELLIKKEVTEKIQVPDPEIKKHYDANIDRYKVPDQVQASHILLKNKINDELKKLNRDIINANKDKTPAGQAKVKELEKQKAKKEKEVKKEDQALLAKLYKVRSDIRSKKKDFAAAAKGMSDCPSKDKGGDLGLFSKGRMVKEFEEVAFNSKVGSISKPFKSPFGYHIVQVTKKEPARTKTFDEVKAEIKDQLTKQRSNAKIREYLDKLKKAAKVVSYLKTPPPSAMKSMPMGPGGIPNLTTRPRPMGPPMAPPMGPPPMAPRAPMAPPMAPPAGGK